MTEFNLQRTTDVLLVVDVQRDFMPGGALSVPDGDAVLPAINRLLDRFTHAVATQDSHPRGHTSFASSHPGTKPFETVMLSYGEQRLWPDHCVHGTAGICFHPDLDLRKAEMIIRKGFDREIDSYSGFRENDRKTPTGLNGYLRERGFRRVFIAGLARDYCVQFTAEDGLELGYQVVVIEDACRPIDAVAAAVGHSALLARGARSISSAELLGS